MAESAAPETASFSEFAGIAGFKPAYITQLRKGGRLVLTEDGKRVRVAESLERIQATRDPSKAGVSARHAAARDADAVSPAKDDGAGDGADELGEPTGQVGKDYQSSRAMREHYLALSAKREHEVSIGKLLDAEQAAAATAAVVTALRARLESLPDIIGPQMVPITDESAARAIIAEAIEHMLNEASRQLSAIAKAGQP